ncbi:MAG: histidine--tRNA ligase [Candidatus Muiribacteriota bacterium]
MKKRLKGFKDIMPSEMILKNKFLNIITSIFENYGFSPVETPALEYLETLLGKSGDENEKLMYKFKDNGGRDVGLRYDLTIPLARFIATNFNEINFPFKRYHIAPVWRAENPQKGRYREFYQCDCDITGTNSYLSDAEIIFLIHDVLKALNIDDFIIQVNSRIFFDCLIQELNINEKAAKELGVLIDKKDKMPQDKFIKAYSNILKTDENKKLFEKFMYKTSSISDLENIFTSKNKKQEEHFNNFKKMFEVIKPILNYVKFTPHIIRGLDYYTGVVYETILQKSPEYGAVFSGGRYDNLIGSFTGRESIPAVGASIGISRLIAALEDRGFFNNDKKTVSSLIVFNFDETLEPYYSKLIHKLRQNNINIDFYYKNDKIKKQFKYAEKQGYDFALLIGKNEIDSKMVKLKDLKNFKQIEISFNELEKLTQKKLETIFE